MQYDDAIKNIPAAIWKYIFLNILLFRGKSWPKVITKTYLSNLIIMNPDMTLPATIQCLTNMQAPMGTNLNRAITAIFLKQTVS